MIYHLSVCKPLSWININLILLFVIFNITGYTSPVFAFLPVMVKTLVTFLPHTSKHLNSAVTGTKVMQLAQTASKPGGTVVVGMELARLNLPNEVLEDTFARILVVQGRVQQDEAQGWIKRLRGCEKIDGRISVNLDVLMALKTGKSCHLASTCKFFPHFDFFTGSEWCQWFSSGDAQEH